MNTAFFWLFLNFISIVVLAFYSMSEMACVSFNKLRLQYYVTKKNKSAELLNWLLHNPSRLFGTTLIGVNVATFFGSEFAREFYHSVGLDPDLSPITQIFLVVIFGELAPMFAARRYAEHVSMLSAPLLYTSAKLLTPFLWAIDGFTRFFSYFLGPSGHEQSIYLTQEELQKILEEKSDDRPIAGLDSENLNAATANIFSLRHKDVRQAMEPIRTLKRLPSTATVAQVMSLLRKTDEDFVAIYHRELPHIIGIAHVYDLIRIPDNRRVRDFLHPPLFVTQSTHLMQLLHQFSRTQETIAIILNKQGHAEGYIRRDDIIDELTGPLPSGQIASMTFIERTVSGDMTVGEFYDQFDVLLDQNQEETLSELLIARLGHQPERGESIFITPYELSVEEVGMRHIKTIGVKTRLT